MKTTHCLVFWMTILLALPVAGQTGRSGEAVFQAVCASCHSTKVDKAPQLGDRVAWRPLLREGQVALSTQGWLGVRSMPAQGGQPDLALAEFARAVAYMARSAGGDWADPDEEMLEQIERRIAKRRAKLKAKAGA